MVLTYQAVTGNVAKQEKPARKLSHWGSIAKVGYPRERGDWSETVRFRGSLESLFKD